MTIFNKYLNKTVLIIIAILLGVNNIFVGYKIGGISYDRFFEIIIFFMLIGSFLKIIRHDKIFKFLVHFILFLIFLKVVKFEYFLVINQNLSLTDFLRIFAKNITFIVYIFLAYYLAIKDIKKYTIILFVYLFAFMLAFFQHPMTPLSDIAMSIKMQYFSVNMDERFLSQVESILRDPNAIYTRVSGPYGFSIILSYALMSAAIISVFLFNRTKDKLYLYYFIFVLIVSIMSLTRSLLLGEIILLFYLIFFSSLRNSKYTYIFTFFTILIFIYFILDEIASNSEIFSRIFTTNDESAKGKIPLAITGLYAVLLNPLGVTESAYMSVKQEMYQIFHTEEILKYSAHNAFVNLGFHYTIFGYIVFIYFLLKMYKYSKILNNEKRKFWFFATIAYFVHSSLHNNGLFIGDYNILLVLALFIYDIRETIIEKKISRKIIYE